MKDPDPVATSNDNALQFGMDLPYFSDEFACF